MVDFFILFFGRNYTISLPLRTKWYGLLLVHEDSTERFLRAGSENFRFKAFKQRQSFLSIFYYCLSLL